MINSTAPTTSAAPVFTCNINSGDTTWVLISAVLVLGMMPGLAFFEAGLLRPKNTLSIITQIFGGLVTLSCLWDFFGYSVVYDGDYGGVIGGLRHAFLIDVPYGSCTPNAPNIPAAAFAMFEMMFAAITPLLITGAFAERMKWSSFFTFTIVWEICVYYPVAHWIWGGGWLQAQLGVLDFAGGIVIHTTAGAASLVCALVLGRRRGFDVKTCEFPPSNVPLACVGATFLFMGWFGFNAGSALSGGVIATSTVISTQVAAAVSGFTWLMLSWWRFKPSCLALINGVVAGLAGVTPASGYINTQWTILLGFVLGVASYFSVLLVKFRLHIDDALDVSSVHGLTGVIGSLFIGLASERALNPKNGADGLFYGRHSLRLLGAQMTAVAVAGLWSAGVTLVTLLVLKQIFGLKVTDDEEDEGVDTVEHGESAYSHLAPHSLLDRERERLVNRDD